MQKDPFPFESGYGSPREDISQVKELKSDLERYKNYIDLLNKERAQMKMMLQLSPQVQQQMRLSQNITNNQNKIFFSPKQNQFDYSQLNLNNNQSFQHISQTPRIHSYFEDRNMPYLQHQQMLQQQLLLQQQQQTTQNDLKTFPSVQRFDTDYQNSNIANNQIQSQSTKQLKESYYLNEKEIKSRSKIDSSDKWKNHLDELEQKMVSIQNQLENHKQQKETMKKKKSKAIKQKKNIQNQSDANSSSETSDSSTEKSIQEKKSSGNEFEYFKQEKKYDKQGINQKYQEVFKNKIYKGLNNLLRDLQFNQSYRNLFEQIVGSQEDFKKNIFENNYAQPLAEILDFLNQVVYKINKSQIINHPIQNNQIIDFSNITTPQNNNQNNQFQDQNNFFKSNNYTPLSGRSQQNENQINQYQSSNNSQMNNNQNYNGQQQQHSYFEEFGDHNIQTSQTKNHYKKNKPQLIIDEEMEPKIFIQPIVQSNSLNIQNKNQISIKNKQNGKKTIPTTPQSQRGNFDFNYQTSLNTQNQQQFQQNYHEKRSSSNNRKNISIMPCLKNFHKNNQKQSNSNNQESMDHSNFTTFSQSEKDKQIIKNRSIPLKQPPVGIDQVGRKGRAELQTQQQKQSPII